jgi:hypothetical protein
MWHIVLGVASMTVIGGTLDALGLRPLVWWLTWWSILLLAPLGALYVAGKLLRWWR